MHLTSDKKYQGGSSLIETMVSLFILGLGLLGTLSLEIGSLKVNQSAYQGTEAQLLAADMADRILAYDDLETNADDNDFDGVDTRTTYTDPGCRAIGCSDSEQVQYAAFEWQQALSQNLPSAIGLVEYSGEDYTVTVMWDRFRTGARGTGCSGDPDVDLSCFSLTL